MRPLRVLPQVIWRFLREACSSKTWEDVSSELLVTVSNSPLVPAEKEADSQRRRGGAGRREFLNTSRHDSSQVFLGSWGTPALPMFLQTSQFPFVPKLTQVRSLSFAINSANTPQLHKHHSSSFPSVPTTPCQSPLATSPTASLGEGLRLFPRLSTFLSVYPLPASLSTPMSFITVWILLTPKFIFPSLFSLSFNFFYGDKIYITWNYLF